MQTAWYPQEPEALRYMALPDGRADVWLRADIARATDEDGDTGWTCTEVYFRTALTQDEVEAGFDELYANGGPVVDEDAGTETVSEPTLAERMEAVEAAVLELAEVVANG